MGCDIHLHFEKKNKEGKWVKIEMDDRIVPDDRDYYLFAYLADVRNFRSDEKIKPWFPARGIPSDSCLDSDFRDCASHSHTYAYLDEILAAPWKENEMDHNYFYIFCKNVLPRIIDCFPFITNEQHRDIRVIMGFDN